MKKRRAKFISTGNLPLWGL